MSLGSTAGAIFKAKPQRAIRGGKAGAGESAKRVQKWIKDFQRSEKDSPAAMEKQPNRDLPKNPKSGGTPPSGGSPTARGGSEPAGGGNSAVAKRGSSSATVPRGARSARGEKEVRGSHEVQRVPGLTQPEPGTRQRKVGRYILAGAAAAGGVALMGGDDKESTPSVPKPTPISMGTGSGSKSPSSKSPSSAPMAPSISVDAGYKASPLPASASSPKKAAGGTSKGAKGPSQYEQWYASLSKDSAVKHYVDTGKHKYPTKKAKASTSNGRNPSSLN